MSETNLKVDALFEGREPGGDGRAAYETFHATCALTARIDRAAVGVRGPRHAEMLNGLVTNQVANLSEGGRYAFLLSAKGRVLTDMRVLPRTDDLLLDIPREGLDNLLSTFKKYLPPIYATFEDLSGDLSQIAVYGPSASAAVAGALGAVPAADHLAVTRLTRGGDQGGELLLVRNRRMAGDGVEIWCASAIARQLAADLLASVEDQGGHAAAGSVLEIVRVEWGIPRYGVDMSEENLAQETGLEAEAISYDKGCYLGQEVVARLHYRGHVNRRLMGLRFAGPGAGRGAELRAGGKSVGQVTSAAESPTYGPIGLGYVRREVEPGERLRWSSSSHAGDAVVVSLPFREADV